MSLVLITNLAPINQNDHQFFKQLISGIQSYGHDCVFWSTIYHKDFADVYLPMSWRVKEWVNFYKSKVIKSSNGYNWIDPNIWLPRVSALCKQDCENKEKLLKIIVNVSYNLLKTIKPDLFLSWNTLCPHTGIAHDMCKQLGIKSILIERAVFPDTWFMEEGGLLGHSVITNKTLEELIGNDKEKFINFGIEYVKKMDFTDFNKYQQKTSNKIFEEINNNPEYLNKTKIVFLPPDDLTLGFYPTDCDDRKKTLPDYANSFEAAKKLSEKCDGIVVFKPHPSFLEQKFDTDGYDNLFVIDYDFRELIKWGDIIATTGSGLEFIALANRKPVITMGKDLLYNKNIAYEAIHDKAISLAIDDAKKQKKFTSKINNFYAYVGYLLTHYFVNLNFTNKSYFNVDNAVAMLQYKYLFNNSQCNIQFIEERKSLLQRKILKKLNSDISVKYE